MPALPSIGSTAVGGDEGVVSVVPGGPVEKAGTKPGEIITALGATSVHSPSDLVIALAKLDLGTSVEVTVSDAQGHSTRSCSRWASRRVAEGGYPRPTWVNSPHGTA